MPRQTPSRSRRSPVAPLVLHPWGFGLRRQIDTLCAAAGFQPCVTHESDPGGDRLGLVEAGLGITILPASATRQDLTTHARPLVASGARTRRQIGLATRIDRYVSVAACNVFGLAQELPPIVPHSA